MGKNRPSDIRDAKEVGVELIKPLLLATANVRIDS